MIKFCPMCGTKLNDKAKICRGCGLSVKAYEAKIAKLSAVKLLNLGHKCREAKDYENALRYYLKAAAAGNTDAMYQVGEMYYYGMGVAADIAKAKEWYKKSGKKINNAPAAPKVADNDSAAVKPAQEKSSPKIRDESAKKISNEPAAPKVTDNTSADMQPAPKTQSNSVQKEIAIVSAPEPVHDENTFSILGCEYTFKPNFVTYNSVHRIFVANAYKKRKEFTAEYNERVHNFDEFYSVGLNIFKQKIFETAALSVKVVKQIREISIAPEEMLRICCNERLVQMDTFLLPLKKVYDKIVAAAEQLAAYRGLERSSRSRWSGGGFGFTGAIKGAIQAGILNMATDAVRGIGDSFTDAGDRRKIAQLKAQALNDENFYNGCTMLQYTENTLETFCLNFFDGITPIIDLPYVLTKADVNFSDQILHKITNYRPYDFKDLIEAIFRNPFEPALYLTIFNMRNESYHDLENLAEYVGLQEKFLDMLMFWYLQEIIDLAPAEKDTLQTIQDKKDRLSNFRTDLDYGIFLEAKKVVIDRLSSAEVELREQSKKSDDGCFITTAVCGSFGKPDDCYELTAFRNFRDTWLAAQPDGKILIAEYYAVAPKIVAAINRFAEPARLYREIWKIFLEPCLKNIERGKFSDCKKIYVAMVKQLEKIFIG